MRIPLALAFVFAAHLLAQPVISTGGIVNATGYQTVLAPDTVFTIFGSGMGPAALTTSAAPYPTTLGGTSILFASSTAGPPISAKMIYTSAGQIAGLLPSSITPGTYAVTVTYNSQSSAPQNVTVVSRSFGIATANNAGTGAAQVTIGNVNGGVSLVRLTGGSLAFNGLTWTLAPAHPNDTLVIWGTGGGADAQNDNGGSSGDQTAAGNFSVILDGTSITPAYAGASSGYPGLWQINFVVPQNIAPDCFATLQVSAGGRLSNNTTIAIAAAGQNSCSSQISSSTLNTLSSSGNIVMAGLTIGTVTDAKSGPFQILGGVFNRYTAAEFLIPYSGPKYGMCNILDETYPSGGKEPSYPDALLDAGVITVSGPNLPAQPIGAFAGPSGPAYSASLAPGTLVNGGTYTLTGAGGTQVGPFTATGTIPNNFSVTNLSALATVDRTQPLLVNWTGAGFDTVEIAVQSGSNANKVQHSVEVFCVVPASLGTYSIPTAALANLVAAGSTGQVVIQAVISAGGTISAESSTSTALTPPLAGGGKVDFGGFAPELGFTIATTIQ